MNIGYFLLKRIVLWLRNTVSLSFFSWPMFPSSNPLCLLDPVPGPRHHPLFLEVFHESNTPTNPTCFFVYEDIGTIKHEQVFSIVIKFFAPPTPKAGNRSVVLVVPQSDH